MRKLQTQSPRQVPLRSSLGGQGRITYYASDQGWGNEARSANTAFALTVGDNTKK